MQNVNFKVYHSMCLPNVHMWQALPGLFPSVFGYCKHWMEVVEAWEWRLYACVT